MTTATQTHTPGPWGTSGDAVPHGYTQRWAVNAESNGERVATVFHTEANARLIAAAPDLLAALVGLISELELATCDSAHNGARFDDAIAAIAAAKGEA